MKLLALVLFLAAPAVHADAGAWKGSYAGVNVGGARAHSTWRTDATSGPPAAETVDQSVGSGIIGGQIGYRFAASEHLLLGLVLQGQGAKIEARDPSTFAAGRERVTRVRDPVSAAVQVGFAGSSVLAYLRGGAAYATIELEAINQLPGGATATWDHHATGWTAGAGFEVLLRPKLSLGLQYDYYKLRAVSLSTVDNGGVTRNALEFETRIQAVHVRTSIRF
jgi:outer membrane immunogenic protein